MKQQIKQTTYLVTVNEDILQEVLNSKMAFIRDWNMRWFDVPASFYDEFKNKFGIEGVESSICKLGITKEEINRYNYVDWHKGATAL